MKNNSNKVRQTVFIGIFATLTIILSYLEHLLPPLFAAVPGIKMGLPNIIIIFMLYRFGFGYAAAVSFIRLIVSALLFGNVMTFAYSLAGAVLSLALMALLKKLDIFSMVVVSIAGAIAHNIGQIIVAVLLLDTTQIAYYMIVLAIAGTISGLFVGLIGVLMIKRVPLGKNK